MSEFGISLSLNGNATMVTHSLQFRGTYTHQSPESLVSITSARAPSYNCTFSASFINCQAVVDAIFIREELFAISHTFAARRVRALEYPKIFYRFCVIIYRCPY